MGLSVPPLRARMAAQTGQTAEGLPESEMQESLLGQAQTEEVVRFTRPPRTAVWCRQVPQSFFLTWRLTYSRFSLRVQISHSRKAQSSAPRARLTSSRVCCMGLLRTPLAVGRVDASFLWSARRRTVPKRLARPSKYYPRHLALLSCEC